jgi:hypothetical protein
MTNDDVVFRDCEYRYLDGELLRCASMKSVNDDLCDNCKSNVHLNCQNYVPKNDMCLLYFELGVSEVSQYDTCAEKIIYDDKELQRKWSN